MESRARSWWHLITTFVALFAALYLAAQPIAWPWRAIASVLAGLVLVRGFILFHDFMHGALFRGSPVARAILNTFGVLVLTPPRVWRQTHDYHHAHNAKIVGSHVGSYPVMTVEMWERASKGSRAMYRVARHPLTVFLGYGGIFLYGMCLSGFLRRPRRNWDAALALVLHAAILGTVGYAFGMEAVIFCVLIPIMTACGMGAYLFYAQHNFVGLRLQPREQWNYVRAALESSSYMELGPIMRWFTGNIGFHHVHHLNPTIPFYRLPEAHAAIPEFAEVRRIRLAPSDIIAGFRLKLWDANRQEMVPFPRRVSTNSSREVRS